MALKKTLPRYNAPPLGSIKNVALAGDLASSVVTDSESSALDLMRRNRRLAC